MEDDKVNTFDLTPQFSTSNGKTLKMKSYYPLLKLLTQTLNLSSIQILTVKFEFNQFYIHLREFFKKMFLHTLSKFILRNENCIRNIRIYFRRLTTSLKRDCLLEVIGISCGPNTRHSASVPSQQDLGKIFLSNRGGVGDWT